MNSRRWCLFLVGIVVTVMAGSLLWPSVAVAQGGWNWQNPLPQGNSLAAVWGTSVNDVFAVGAAGTIIHYDGSTWTTQPSGTTENLMAVWGSSATDVYAVGGDFYRPVILHYDGAKWTSLYVSGDELHGVWGSSSTDVFAVGRQGVILHYDGASWSYMAGAAWTDLNAVWGSSSTDVYVAADSGAIYHYDGSSWTSTTHGTDDLLYVWGLGPTDIYFVSYNRTILHYDGANWSATPDFGAYPLRIWGSSANDLFAVGDEGSITGAIWHSDGTTWTAVGGISGGTLAGVWGSSPTDVFAVGAGGAIWHFDGSRWASMYSSVPSGELAATWGISANDIFAVGDGGSILRFDGAVWSTVESPTTAALKAIWGSSSNDIFAVGSGVILHYDGATWRVMDGAQYSLLGVWGTSVTDVFAVGDEGLILHYDGMRWNSMPSDTNSQLTAVWGSSSNDVFAVGGFGQIVHYDGASWSSIPSGTRSDLKDVWGSSSSNVIALGYDGMLHFDGLNWRAMSGPPGASAFSDVWGTGTSDIYTLSDRNATYHFDGATWQRIETHISGYLNDIWGDCARGVFAVGAGILRHPGCWLNLSLPVGDTGRVVSTPPIIDCGSPLAAICNAAFEYASPVTLALTTHPSATFLGWSGACHGTGACALTMDSTKDVTARFALPLKVNRVGIGNGTLTSSPPAIDCGHTCQASVLGGSEITLTATAGAYTTFDGWSFPTVDGWPTGYCSIDPPCVLTMHAAREVTATFTLQTPPGSFPLLVSKAGSGSGVVTNEPVGTDGAIDCGPTCNAPFPAGTFVTLTATAGASSIFTGWSGDCTGTGPCAITLDGAKAVTATFTLQTFPLTVIKTGIGRGTVASSPVGVDDAINCGSICSATFLKGQTVSLAATPEEGHAFEGWSDACSGTGLCSVTMDAPKTVTAAFTVPGAIMAQGITQYYGRQLRTDYTPTVATGTTAATGAVTVTHLVAFMGTAPSSLYVVGMEGSEPYVDQIATNKLINRLLRTGCPQGVTGSACSAVDFTCYNPDGAHTNVVITQLLTTDYLYLPLTKRQ